MSALPEIPPEFAADVTAVYAAHFDRLKAEAMDGLVEKFRWIAWEMTSSRMSAYRQAVVASVGRYGEQFPAGTPERVAFDNYYKALMSVGPGNVARKAAAE